MNKTDIPTPIYAAAGAGELAYQKLRKLPEAAARTARNAGETADELRQRINGGDRPLGERVRQSAERGRTAVVSTATSAQELATTSYRRLVARGERVVAERFGNGNGQEQPSQVEVIVGPVQPADRGATVADPMAADPMAADPMAADPMAADPMAGAPMVDPTVADPMAADPAVAKPTTGKSTTSKRTGGAAKRPTTGA